MMEENYKDGVLREKSVFYPNGNLAEEIHYNKGIKRRFKLLCTRRHIRAHYHKNHLHGKAAYFDAKA